MSTSGAADGAAAGPPSSPGQHYVALRAKVDAHVARVERTYQGDMRCRAGCAACCMVELSVLALEGEAIAEAVSAMSPSARAAVAARASLPLDPLAPRCAALDEQNRCSIYAVRPLVCRSHGVPIRSGDLIDACSLNFHQRPPSTVPATDVLVQATLSTVLLALDAARAAACGNVAGEREPLRLVLAAAAR